MAERYAATGVESSGMRHCQVKAALRGRRPLRGGYIGFAYCLPMVG
ncbi:MAG TPA: hypothetical protein VK627_07665 [Edaphobacter sp.]|nr:hypothetical protein [Edaphobacter sp.]